MLDPSEPLDRTLPGPAAILVVLGDVDTIPLVEQTLGVTWGTIGAMPQRVHSRISSLLKYPRSATTVSSSLPADSFAFSPILDSCSRSRPSLVTSCATIR